MARLLFAASDSNADALYATRFAAPDPFIYIEAGGKSLVVLSDLEVGRGRKEARVDEVLSSSILEQGIRKRTRRRKVSVADVIIDLLRKRRVRTVRVPGNFPVRLADELRAGGMKVRVPKGPFWPERAVKSAAELRMMDRAVRLAEVGVLRGMEVLRRSRAGRDGVLTWSGAVLTSERLRAEIDSAALLAGGLCESTIAAGGRQACDPHDRGSGPLRANELIILDVFPRDTATGYYGDLTRTVVRGRASEAQRALWQAVADVQIDTIKQVRPGVNGARLQKQVKAKFKALGYMTEERDGRMTGFFHGLGHGLGLELHEEPRLAAATLAPGNVFTIEPGLYYPEIGGVRIEDDVVVTSTGRKILGSGLPRQLEI